MENSSNNLHSNDGRKSEEGRTPNVLTVELIKELSADLDGCLVFSIDYTDAAAVETKQFQDHLSRIRKWRDTLSELS